MCCETDQAETQKLKKEYRRAWLEMHLAATRAIMQTMTPIEQAEFMAEVKHVWVTNTLKSKP